MCLQRRGRDQELGDLHLYTVSHTLRSMLALGGSLSPYMCTLNVLYIQSSLSGGTAMASRCPSIFRERTLTGELPSVHEGRCPSLMLPTFLAINLTHKWDQTTATCTKLWRRPMNLHVQPDTPARHMRRCTRLEIYARVAPAGARPPPGVRHFPSLSPDIRRIGFFIITWRKGLLSSSHRSP